MRVFKWRQTHFTLVEQYTVTLMQDLRTCQTADDGQTLIMVVGSDSANEVNANLDPLTIVEVYMFADDRMRHVQNLHTHWASLHTGFWDGRCVLIAMPDRRSSGLQRSEVYVFDYSFHVAADQQMVVFDDMVTNNYDLVVVQNQVNAFYYILPFVGQIINTHLSCRTNSPHSRRRISVADKRQRNKYHHPPKS